MHYCVHIRVTLESWGGEGWSPPTLQHAWSGSLIAECITRSLSWQIESLKAVVLAPEEAILFFWVVLAQGRGSSITMRGMLSCSLSGPVSWACVNCTGRGDCQHCARRSLSNHRCHYGEENKGQRAWATPKGWGEPPSPQLPHVTSIMMDECKA